MSYHPFTLRGALFVCMIAAFSPFTTRAAEAPEVRSDAVLIYTNIERHARGIPLLQTSALLSKVAERKMRDLFARQYFAHEAPTGEDVSDLADSVGYAYLAVGENLAMGDFTSSKHVVRSWMESVGHRENILAKKYSEIGIAAGRGSYKGETVWMVVQTFGTPRSSCPAIDEAKRDELDILQSKITMLDHLLVMRRGKVDDRSVSRSVHAKRILAYNETVNLYNSYIARYREELAAYNNAVNAFNACLTAKVGSV